MPKGVTTKTDVLKVCLINSYDPAWRTNGSVYIGLHNGDPSAGDQTTNETAYTNYTRVAVAKTAGGWSIVGDTASNVAAIDFLTCGITGDTLSYVSIGTVASPGTGQIIYCGQLTANLIVSNLIQPRFAIGALSVVEG